MFETFLQEGGASWLKFVRLVLFLVLLPRVLEGGSRGKMGFTAVENVPAGSKPPVTVGVRISTGEGHGFSALASLSTRPSSLNIGRRVEGSAILPKLVKLVGSSSALAEELFPFITRSAAAPSVRLRALVSGSTSTSVVKCGY